jgi:hypothetical protein
MLRRVHGRGWPMQQNGQTDRSSIVGRLQAVVGKDRLVVCIRQCLPEAAGHQVRTGLVYTAIGGRAPSNAHLRLPRQAQEVPTAVHAVPVRSSTLKEQQAVEIHAGL